MMIMSDKQFLTLTRYLAYLWPAVTHLEGKSGQVTDLSETSVKGIFVSEVCQKLQEASQAAVKIKLQMLCFVYFKSITR